MSDDAQPLANPAEWAQGRPARKFRFLAEPAARAVWAEQERDEAEAGIKLLEQELAASREREVGTLLLLAQVSEWAIEAGGWRLFYYGDTAPAGVFDLSDRFNPDIAEHLQQALAAHTAAGDGAGNDDA